MNHSGLFISLSLGMASLLATTALAQVSSDNDAVATQNGTDNSALIEQIGSFNRAGSDADPLFQDGVFNDLDILQQGIGNRIGLAAPGLEQTGLQNTQTIFNRIRIDQTADDNIVGSVVQTSEGSVVNGANTLVIEQGGSGNNIVEVVRQTQQDGQAAQFATVEQTGQFNRVALIDQLANSNAFDQDNVITVRITGVSNGTTGLSGYAAQPSVTDSGIIQEAGNGDVRSNGNTVDLLSTGDQNRFGIRQGGRMNTVGFITIGGDNNELGIRQDGTENDVAITPIEGDDNNVGIDQLGTNIAIIIFEAGSPGSGLPLSDRNRVLILQDGTNDITISIEGDDNDFTSDQDFDGNGLGGDNSALVSLFGNGNVGRLTQLGDNRFTLALVGNDNNALPFDGAFDAAGQVAGEFHQEGAGNDAALTVTGDGNRFGLAQIGADNQIVAMILGSQNQMALAQVGVGNLADLSQAGHGNRATVLQN